MVSTGEVNADLGETSGVAVEIDWKRGDGTNVPIRKQDRWDSALRHPKWKKEAALGVY